MTDQIPNPPIPPESQTPPTLPESPAPGAPTPGGAVPPRRSSSGLAWGAILILIGIFALISQVTRLDLGLYFLPLLAVIFLLAGVLGRRFGLIIPGGILAGIGVGSLLIEGPFSYLTDQSRGGMFMLAFAGGWLVITLASLLIGRQVIWPLIPAAFIGLFGIVLLAGQSSILNTIGWPIILIAIGLYLVLRRRELTK